MKIINTRFQFATIGIISGHPRFDKTAAKVMDVLAANSKEKIQFIGVIGKEYQGRMDHTYADSSLLDHEEIVVTRNYREEVEDSWLTPFRAITHYKNSKVLKVLHQKKFYEDLIIKEAPAVIAVGNFSLMNRIFTTVSTNFAEIKAVKPLRLSFDLMNAYRTLDNQSYLDFLYNNLPRKPQNLTNYIFPSLCIGYEGLFKAFQFLQKYKEDPANDSFLFKQFSYSVSGLVSKAREEYRNAHGINQDHYLILLAPGNTDKQIEFSFNKFKQSLGKFSARPEISTIDAQFFKVLILLPNEQKLSSKIRSLASSLSSKYPVEFVEEKDKYAAMCASDYALMHTGEVTVEAAACQLPVTVISSMSNYKAYLSYLYNGHQSPLNVSTNYEGYQDLLGSWTAISEKISNLMVEHFQRPKLRFYYTKLYREQIQKMLMLNGRNPELRVSKTGLQWAAEDIFNKIELHKKLQSSPEIRSYERKQRLQLY